MVEQPAVNRRVTGSSPVSGASINSAQPHYSLSNVPGTSLTCSLHRKPVREDHF